MSPSNPNPVAEGESPLLPSGWIYYPGPAMGVAADRDVVIDFRGGADEVTIPLRIWAARNVHIIGLQMKLEPPLEGRSGARLVP